MDLPRCSGVLLHITSLPGRFGIGDLGPQAERFIDFLAKSRQHVWQVLPVRPTGYGDSPYQCLSAFAGNPLLISPERLVEDGFLVPEDLQDTPLFPEGRVDFGRVIPFKRQLLKRACNRFVERPHHRHRQAFEEFRASQAGWLDDYALFLAIKESRQGSSWLEWPPAIALRQPQELGRLQTRLADEVRFHQFVQFLVRQQWDRLHDLCQRRGIRLMGDIPIFAALDSADVWAHRELFQLDPSGRPVDVAGVPPDYFSETGQLWGNPLYDWDKMARGGFAWWLARLRSELAWFDVLRLDHFRGFQAYWAVPASETTAINGRWVNGPGDAFFSALREHLGEPAIVAENLGLITPEVEELRERWGFPGMAVLQFAFGSDQQAGAFHPHNYRRRLVVYTGTHDNDTIQGWWQGGAEGSTRKSEEVRKEKEYAASYLDIGDRPVHEVFIRSALASVADVVIIPVQDLLGLGSAARMNLPGRENGNWSWRLSKRQAEDDLCRVGGQLLSMTELYQRVVESSHDETC